jgi:hypothetical protein
MLGSVDGMDMLQVLNISLILSFDTLDTILLLVCQPCWSFAPLKLTELHTDFRSLARLGAASEVMTQSLSCAGILT